MFYGTDHVTVANAPELDFPPGTPMSIALWIKETTDQPTVHYLGKRANCGGGSTGIDYQIARDATYGIQFNSKAGGIVGTGVGVALNQWRHVAVTYDGTTNLAIYIDGVPTGLSNTYHFEGASTASLLIGGSGTCGGDMIGLIDEVWIFNRQLSDTEVHLLATSNPGTYCTAKVNSLGCTPTMVPGGASPSLSGPDDFYVVADHVLRRAVHPHAGAYFGRRSAADRLQRHLPLLLLARVHGPAQRRRGRIDLRPVLDARSRLHLPRQRRTHGCDSVRDLPLRTAAELHGTWGDSPHESRRIPLSSELRHLPKSSSNLPRESASSPS
jgi:hypothetical protein